MQENGASAGAVAVARRFGATAFVSAFKRIGVVSLATLTSPFAANSNDQPILVNGSPAAVNVSDEGAKVDLTQNAGYAAVIKRIGSAFSPSIAGQPTFQWARNSSGDGQQFMFAFSIRNGCQACREVAVAHIRFDFDRSGRYVGSTLLALVGTADTSGAGSADRESGATRRNAREAPSRPVSPDSLITDHSVGPVRVGMTTVRVRRVLLGALIERGTNGDGATLYVVRRDTLLRMVLYPHPRTAWAKVDETTPLGSIEAMDPSFTTAEGAHPGMMLHDVEGIYGSLIAIRMSEVESHEFATFSKAPAGIAFRVSGDGKPAGIYASGESTTMRYDSSARVLSLIASRLGESRSDTR
jgi:hypothetical protein